MPSTSATGLLTLFYLYLCKRTKRRHLSEVLARVCLEIQRIILNSHVTKSYSHACPCVLFPNLSVSVQIYAEGGKRLDVWAQMLTISTNVRRQ